MTYIDRGSVAPDGVDLSDEKMITVREVMDDFLPDRRLSETTVERLKRAAYSIAAGVAVAVALAAWPVLKEGLTSGHVDVPTLWETVRAAAVASLSTYIARLRRG